MAIGHAVARASLSCAPGGQSVGTHGRMHHQVGKRA